MKFREATEADADGGGFPFALIGKPPRPRYQWRLRDIPLIARPPLLAVMQGGECACSKLIHSPPPVRLSNAASTAPRETDVSAVYGVSVIDDPKSGVDGELRVRIL